MGSFCYPLSAAARHTPTIGGPSPSPIPDLPGIGDHPRSPSPICRGSGVHPHRHPRFAGDRGSSPSPIPIGDSAPWSAAARAETAECATGRPRNGRRNAAVPSQVDIHFQQAGRQASVLVTARAARARWCRPASSHDTCHGRRRLTCGRCYMKRLFKFRRYLRAITATRALPHAVCAPTHASSRREYGHMGIWAVEASLQWYHAQFRVYITDHMHLGLS